VVNDCLYQFANLYAPFGGVGESGMGGYHGECIVYFSVDGVLLSVNWCTIRRKEAVVECGWIVVVSISQFADHFFICLC
jgi:hypothetical protein